MKHTLVKKSSLFQLTIGAGLVDQGPAAQHGENQVRRVQILAISKHDGDSARQVLCLIKVELIPLMNICRSEHDLEIVAIDRFKVCGLEE